MVYTLGELCCMYLRGQKAERRKREEKEEENTFLSAQSMFRIKCIDDSE